MVSQKDTQGESIICKEEKKDLKVGFKIKWLNSLGESFPDEQDWGSGQRRMQ